MSAMLRYALLVVLARIVNWHQHVRTNAWWNRS